MRQVFKNQKAALEKKINVNYVTGLAKALGIKTNKDTFSEQNMKSREHIQQLKEKLAWRLIRKLQMENQDIFPTPAQGKKKNQKNVGEPIKLEKLQSSDKKSEGPKRSSSKERSLEATPKDLKLTKIEEIQAKNEMQCLYKYSIGKGNNALMVRSLFKNRFWWMIADKGADMEKVNFMWTQIKNSIYMDTLLCKFPEKKSGLGLKEKSTMKAAASTLPSYPADSLQAKQLENKLYNKIEDNFHVANKKALFLNMRIYYESLGEDPFLHLPVTFHIKNGLADPEFQKFKEHYQQVESEVKERKALRLKMKQERQQARDANQTYQDDYDSPVQSPEKDTKKTEGIAEPETKLPPPIKNIWIIKPGENTNCGNGI